MISPIRAELTVTDNVPFGQPVTGPDGQRSFYALTLEKPQWKEWQPGQFIMLRPLTGESSVWARPMSICRVTSRGLVLFIRVVGPATDRFSRLKSGDKVVVWGPLGTGFEVRPDTPTLLLARGVGIAPFAGYADMHPEPSSLSMLFGHSLPSNNYPIDAMAARMDVESLHDRTPQELDEFHRVMYQRMQEYKDRNGICLACGPMVFLKKVWQFANELDLPTQLLLEERMSCGTGACLGCSTLTSKHWPDPIKAGLPVQTCTSGPVFWAKELDLDASISEGRA
jgi:dihydroorotate dehydrogenase electron transfer subunit